MADRCDKCRFWKRIDGGRLTDYEATPPWVSEDVDENDPASIGIGECMRHPPKVVGLAVQETIRVTEMNTGVRLGFDNAVPILVGSLWPITWEFDWCGEFSKGEAPVEVPKA